MFGTTQMETKFGWTAGAGVEYAVGGPWSVKAEYLYSELDDMTCGALVCGANVDYRLIRGFTSATVAPGGVGKTLLEIVETLAMVSGKPLLGVSPPKRLRVWLWNLEDPRQELERRIQAAAQQYGLMPSDIGDRLLLDCGRDQELVVAHTEKNRTSICRPVLDSLLSENTVAARGCNYR